MFGKLGKLYRTFRQTLEDGHYCAEPGSLLSELFDQFKDKLPELPKIDFAKRLPLLAKLFKSKLIWTSALAAISLQSVVCGTLALVGAGMSFYAMEYVRCRRSRDEIIEEVNFAGQTVRGKRGDLSRLHKAQEKIMTLSGIFNDVAVGTSAKEIEQVIDGVHEQRRRVLVVDNGKFGASHNRYDFSEPDRKVEVSVGSTPSPVVDTGLKDAWNKKREDEVVERIIALESALPPQVIEKVRRRRGDIAPRPMAPPGSHYAENIAS